MGKLFGTDGIRGKANDYPMTPELALKLGKAIAMHFRNGTHPRIVIGKDTRLSGYMLESALTSGLVSMGATVFLVGPLPTPAIAYLTREIKADAGIMISASHNPSHDNGIKIFSSEGFKLSDSEEGLIEETIFSESMKNEEHNGHPIGKAYRFDDALERYAEFAKESVPGLLLSEMKIVVDCANGAAYKVAPLVLTGLDAEVIQINSSPDGININHECGATDLKTLSKKVVEEKADLGLAFDGDADRLVVVDEKGDVIDGDKLLAFLATGLKEKNELSQDTVVATVMSNTGFENYLKGKGICLKRVKVGDRYVLEELKKNSYNFGGEQSGHIIFKDYSTTGDGLISALQFLNLLVPKKKKASFVTKLFKLYPQVLKNVHVSEKKPLEELPELTSVISEAENSLKGKGRVFVRYSGTENIMRIMVEGESLEQINSLSESIVSKTRELLGGE